MMQVLVMIFVAEAIHVKVSVPNERDEGSIRERPALPE
jgi:hypothetical protein